MTDYPYAGRPERRRTGLRAETKAAKRLGGRTVPGSGSVDGLKGDITLEHFLVESKSTQKKSISIKYEYLHKIDMEGLGVNKYPALIIQFTDANGDVKRNGSWVMVPEHIFKELNETFKETSGTD